jgi:ABC-2 type transport system ATP-binding protein
VAQGTTVLLTTQYLDEADRLSDRIAVIDHGRIIADDTPGRLKSSVGSGVLHVRLEAAAQRERAQRILAGALGVPVHHAPDPAALTARIDADPSHQDASIVVAQAMTRLSHDGIKVTTFSLGQPSLDEVFLALTDHPAEPTEAAA